MNAQSKKPLSDKANQIEEISKNLAQSQKDANDKQKQIEQLQQAIDKGNKDLASLDQQKQQLADSLKQSQDSIPGKINEVRQPLEEKISDLNTQYTNAQKAIADKARQIEETIQISSCNAKWRYG